MQGFEVNKYYKLISKYFLEYLYPKLWYNVTNQKRDMRFGTWNVRSPYKSGYSTTEARELGRNKLELVVVQDGEP